MGVVDSCQDPAALATCYEVSCLCCVLGFVDCPHHKKTSWVTDAKGRQPPGVQAEAGGKVRGDFKQLQVLVLGGAHVCEALSALPPGPLLSYLRWGSLAQGEF